MSVKIMYLVWQAGGLSATEKLVLLKLADCASDDGRNAYPSVARVCHECGLTDRTVRAKLSELIVRGILRFQVGDRKGGARPTTYQIDVARLEEITAPYSKREEPISGAPLNQIPPSPESLSGVPRNYFPPTPEAVSAEPSLEPSIEPSFNLDAELGDLPNIAFGRYRDLAMELNGDIAIPSKLTAKQKQQLTARLRDCGGLAGFKVLLDHIRASPYLRGHVPPARGHRQFQLHFRWILHEENFSKIIEGYYAHRSDRRSRPNEGVARAIAVWDSKFKTEDVST